MHGFVIICKLERFKCTSTHIEYIFAYLNVIKVFIRKENKLCYTIINLVWQVEIKSQIMSNLQHIDDIGTPEPFKYYVTTLVGLMREGGGVVFNWFHDN